jgi:hypothetical protein
MDFKKIALSRFKNKFVLSGFNKELKKAYEEDQKKRIIKKQQEQKKNILINDINQYKNIIKKKVFYITDDEANIIKINIKKPLLLQNFINKEIKNIKDFKEYNKIKKEIIKTGNNITYNIDPQKKYNFRVSIELYYTISDDYIHRHFNFTYTGEPDKEKIINEIFIELKIYLMSINMGASQNIFYRELDEKEKEKAHGQTDNTMTYTFFIDTLTTTNEEKIKEKINDEFLDGANHINIFIYSLEEEPEKITIYKEDIKQDIILYDKLTLYKFNNMLLEREKPLKIFNSIYEHYEPPEGENCVLSYIRDTYKNISYKNIKSLLTDEPTAETIKIFCIKYNIKLRIYNINKQLVNSHDIKTRSRHKSLILAIYNNHIYPINNKKILKKADINYEYIYIKYNEIDEKFNEYLNNHILPEDINITEKGQNIISSFRVENLIYHLNDEYEKCKNILFKFGLLDKITIYTRLSNIYKIIEKLYIKDNINSLWDNADLYIKGGYNYHNEKNEDYENILTIDKNKCYSYALKELDFLIVVDDIRTAEIKNYNNEVLIDHYLYNVIPAQSSIILPDTNIYSGQTLKYALAEGLNFEIKEVLITTKTENIYKSMVKDIYKHLKADDAKDIINRMIGNFSKRTIEKENPTNIIIANHDETEAQKGLKRRFNETYNIIYNIKRDVNIFNRAPIRNEIIDRSRIEIYKQIKKLNININDIIQVKTDSITINNKNNYINYLDMNMDPLDGWKIEENFKEITNRQWDNNFLSLNFKIMEDKDDIIINKNNFYNGYAGCGKSYKIKNDLIKKIKDYIILTPSYATLNEYKIEGINCNVIQKFTLTNTIPEEKNIIVDECGMLNYNDLIMISKCIKLKYKIYFFGDFKQLLPVGENRELNNIIFFNNNFHYNINCLENHRNNFTIEYYDYLRNLKNEDIKKELKIFNINDNILDVEAVICYKRDTVNKYNKMILKKLNLKFDDNGAKVICKSNKLRDYGIYNNFEFTIKEKNEDNIILNNVKLNIDYTIKHKELIKFFIPAYAKTLYNVQGQTLKSFYFAEEDINILDGRRLYTLISRLKQ